MGSDLSGLDKVAVDVEHIGGAKTYLETLSAYVKDELLPRLEKVTFYIEPADNSGASALGGQLVPEAAKIKQKHDSVYNAVKGGLDGVRESLTKTAKATDKIIENYKTTEDRNRANAADILRSFS